ncbi:alginate lyase family protein [Rhodovibrio salinarum]|uniref:alginate lyase family protein n=1 Tax=Rhodovibrio salinarum TaxID=1087 RepID=UPI00147146DB|nr:alginate lyase family protein [Rhodovibrio salinarum]
MTTARHAGLWLAVAALTVQAALGVPTATAETSQPDRQSEDGNKFNRGQTAVTGADGLVSIKEREAFPLEQYKVHDDDASYFDVEQRRQFIQSHGTPAMLAQAEQLSLSQSCADAMNMPVMSHKIQLPGFYPQPKRWRQAAQPFFAFEDAVTRLAGRWVVTGNPEPARCLTRMLAKWAREGGFMTFSFAQATPQAWFAIESSLFAAGLAYSTVSEFAAREMPEKAQKVEDWLNAVSREHISKKSDGPSCCNNHFYRRGLHAAINGVVSDDDELFRYGVAALYSALHEANPDGSLPRELTRGTRAVHYQNYANIYLSLIAQIVQRQGYDIYDVEVKDRTLKTLANWAVDVVRHPAKIDPYVTDSQNRWFMDDPQYFAWMETYIRDFPNEGMQKLLTPRRPTYNRSAGGFMTLYFRKPDPSNEATSQTLVQVGNAFVSETESCAKDPRWHQKRDIEWRRQCERTLREEPPRKHSTGADIYSDQLSEQPDQ